MFWNTSCHLQKFTYMYLKFITLHGDATDYLKTSGLGLPTLIVMSGPAGPPAILADTAAV